MLVRALVSMYLLLLVQRMSTRLDSEQQNGGVGIDSEGRQHHLVQDVLFHPAQLLGQFPGADELEAFLEALLQIL
jgi:hypothetical protein